MEIDIQYAIVNGNQCIYNAYVPSNVLTYWLVIIVYRYNTMCKTVKSRVVCYERSNWTESSVQRKQTRFCSLLRPDLSRSRSVTRLKIYGWITRNDSSSSVWQGATNQSHYRRGVVGLRKSSTISPIWRGTRVSASRVAFSFRSTAWEMLETRPCCSSPSRRREKSTHQQFDVSRFVKFPSLSLRWTATVCDAFPSFSTVSLSSA